MPIIMEVDDEENGGVAAYRLSDGEQLWYVEVDDCCGPADCNISVDRDGIIYLVGDGIVEIDGEMLERPVYAINPDGSVKWVKDIGMYDDDTFHTAVDDQYLYIAYLSNIYLLDKNTGELANQLNGNGSYPCSLTVLNDGSIFVPYMTYTGILINRIDFEDGDIAEYYAMAFEGTLYCIDLSATLPAGRMINGGNGAYTNSLAQNTVTFVSNGGSEIPAQILYTGDRAVEPDNPTRASEAISDTVTRIYTFDKWYIDEECTIVYDFSTPVMDDITLYAGWLHEDKTEPTEPTKPVPPPTDEKPVSPPTGESGGYVLWALLCAAAALGLFGGLSAVGTKTGRRAG